MKLKYIICILIVLISITLICLKCTIKKKSYLPKKNISRNLNKPKLILYTTSWCGNCKKLKKVWTKIKKEILSRFNDLIIEEVDCTDDNSRCFYYNNKNKINIQYVPAIILRNKNSDYVYEKDQNKKISGNNESYDIINFLKQYILNEHYN